MKIKYTLLLVACVAHGLYAGPGSPTKVDRDARAVKKAATLNLQIQRDAKKNNENFPQLPVRKNRANKLRNPTIIGCGSPTIIHDQSETEFDNQSEAEEDYCLNDLFKEQEQKKRSIEDLD